MNLANLLHLFVIILLLSFTANENNKYTEKIEIEHYNIRVELSHLQRRAAKDPENLSYKQEIARLKSALKSDKEYHRANFNITAIKLSVILFFLLIALFQFMRYFRIDFSAPEDKIIALNYRRRTWLLNFVMFMTVSLWCLIYRNNQTWAVISYLVAIATLVQSLFLATELRLVSKQQGGSAFKVTTLFTAVILYFNLMMLVTMYAVSRLTGESIINWLIELNN